MSAREVVLPGVISRNSLEFNHVYIWSRSLTQSLVVVVNIVEGAILLVLELFLRQDLMVQPNIFRIN